MSKNDLKEISAVHRTGDLQMNIYETGYDIPYHWHDEYEFIYVTKGICCCIVNGKNIMVNENELLLIHTGDIHTVNINANSEFFAVVVHPHILGTDCSRFFSSNIRFKNIFNVEDSIDRKIIKNILEVKKCFKQKYFGYEFLLKSYIGNIFGLLFQNKLYTKESEIKNNSYEIFETLIKYINTHYNEPITLQKLSDLSHFSKAYIIHIFKSNTGKTPIEYINRLRVYNAQEMLKNTDNSILEIALENGFENIGYFIKVFKKYIGISPNKWRKGI